MRFWFARDGGVPIREQLVTQIVLGIVCGDLAAGPLAEGSRILDASGRGASRGCAPGAAGGLGRQANQ